MVSPWIPHCEHVRAQPMSKGHVSPRTLLVWHYRVCPSPPPKKERKKERKKESKQSTVVVLLVSLKGQTKRAFPPTKILTHPLVGFRLSFGSLPEWVLIGTPRKSSFIGGGKCLRPLEFSICVAIFPGPDEWNLVPRPHPFPPGRRELEDPFLTIG